MMAAAGTFAAARDDLRVAADRLDRRDRGRRPGRAAAAAGVGSGHACCRHRIAPAGRHGVLDGSGHRGHRDRDAGPAELRSPRRGRCRVDHPPGGRNGRRRLSDRFGVARAAHPRFTVRPFLLLPLRGDRRCGPGHRLRRDDRQGGRPGAVLGPGRRRAARVQRRHVVTDGARSAHRLQGHRLGDLARAPFAVVPSSRRCCWVRRPG